MDVTGCGAVSLGITWKVGRPTEPGKLLVGSNAMSCEKGWFSGFGGINFSGGIHFPSDGNQ